LKLEKEVKQALVAERSPPVKYLHLYCDKLVCENVPADKWVVIDVPTASSLVYIHIFARLLLNQEGAKGLRINSQHAVKLQLIFSHIPVGFAICNNHGTPRSLSKKASADGVELPKIAKDGAGKMNIPRLSLKEQKQLAGKLQENKLFDIAGYTAEFLQDSTKINSLLNVPARELDHLALEPLAPATGSGLDELSDFAPPSSTVASSISTSSAKQNE
jgi:hypothetical protein